MMFLPVFPPVAPYSSHPRFMIPIKRFTHGAQFYYLFMTSRVGVADISLSYRTGLLLIQQQIHLRSHADPRPCKSVLLLIVADKSVRAY
jgi:hypothetical protein